MTKKKTWTIVVVSGLVSFILTKYLFKIPISFQDMTQNITIAILTFFIISFLVDRKIIE